MTTFTLTPGTTPLLVSLPHVGSLIPAELVPRFVERALASEDTDWHLERLYHFVLARGVGLIHSHYSRYVIDLNRPPNDERLYASNTTELCPTRFFTGEPLYLSGEEPGKSEINVRRERYWQPYHNALAAELARLKSQFGYAILYDGHSIRSRLPWLFGGKLPDFNLGTADGTSCSPELQDAIEHCLQTHDHVVNGRFKGGFITRHYGRPDEQIHAIQMEMCQCTYMSESPPYEYDERLAANVQPILETLIDRVMASGGRKPPDSASAQ